MRFVELKLPLRETSSSCPGGLANCVVRIVVGGLWLLCLTVPGLGQEANWIKKSVRLSDASRPATVKVSMLNGSIRVKGNDRKDVVAETQTVPNPAIDPKIEEEDNIVRVHPGPLAKAVNLYVPAKCSLKLACVQAGEIVVENVEGEIEASGLNGSVRLLDISGVAVAHTINGHIKVTFQRLLANKAMSFSTLNGDIDVTLPADTKATVKLEALNGSIHSDFEIVRPGLRGRPKAGVKPGGEIPSTWSTEKVRFGAINGGGPELRFQAFNGTIHLRKK
jgi:hypothetical protein